MIDWTIVVSAAIAALPGTLAALTAAYRSRRTEKSVNGKMEKVEALVSENATAHATLAERKRSSRQRSRVASRDAKATEEEETRRRLAAASLNQRVPVVVLDSAILEKSDRAGASDRVTDR